jgi:hypothetical protein
MSTLHFPLRAGDFQPPAQLRGLSTRALGLGIVAGLVATAGAFVDRDRFFHAYLVGWLFWFAVATGCLGLLMLHHLSGGRWGLVLRRPMEAGARTMPVVGLLAVPLLLGLDRLFIWTDHARVEADHLLHHKAPYLNEPFFIGRTVGAIVIFWLLALLLSRRSVAQDAGRGAALAWSMQKLSAGGLLLWVLVVSFLGFDWLMSLDPHWFSSLFGAIFLAGCGIAALTFLILVARWLSLRGSMAAVFTSRRFHDFGTLLFAFVMFFTYLGISQFIIAYQGNIPEEVIWFKERFHAGWAWVAVALLVFHFFFPFLILLSRAVKRRSGLLAGIAAFVLFMRWVDLIWLTRPTLVHEGFPLTWIDPAALLGIGGLWVFAFARELGRRTLLPVGDPALEEALGHE